MSRKTFKPYHQGQGLALPPYLDELIDDNHLVRIVNQVIDQISDDIICRHFVQEGSSPYHPRMMLKVIVYAYCQKIYSCRTIAKALRESVHFMWLSGFSRPSFNTINRFRSNYFEDILEDVFTEVLDFLHEQKLVNFDTYFVDGSKIEADANKFTYVWKKNTSRYKEAVKEKVKELFKKIEQINTQEDLAYGDKDLEERGIGKTITSEEIKEAVAGINQQLEDEQSKKTKQKLQSLSRNLKKESDNMAKYEQQENLLGERNSYSKTDPDATFIQMKNGEVKPAYNVQISSENQFVTNFTISQNASDSVSFVEHVEKIETRGEKYLPKNYSADSAYGNEENYEKLQNIGIGNYLKFNNFHHEQTKAFLQNPFLKEHFQYDPDQDYYICPKGKKLLLLENKIITTRTGYKSNAKIYQCEDCTGCELKDKCSQSKQNRKIEIREKLENFKAQARSNLTSDVGIVLRKQRNIDVEPVFGDWKHNQGYRRLRLRGKKKALIEIGWLSLSHNLRKLHIKVKKTA
jgi:transposase